MRRRKSNRLRYGVTLTETLIAVALLSMLVILVMAVSRSGRLQEQQVTQFSGLQREARKAIETLQRDIRGARQLELLSRGDQGQLETMVFVVPSDDQPDREARYTFNTTARMLLRNGEPLLSENLLDCQVWPFDHETPPKEILVREDYERLSFLKIRLTLARSTEDGGRGRRVFDFLVYPRLPNAVRKIKEGRLDQAGSRFRQQQ